MGTHSDDVSKEEARVQVDWVKSAFPSSSKSTRVYCTVSEKGNRGIVELYNHLDEIVVNRPFPPHTEAIYALEHRLRILSLKLVRDNVRC